MTRNRSERGIALLASAIWIAALLAITAIAVEVARLSHTATEVQIAADSAALGAALAIAKGNSGGAVAAGKDVAAANNADGHAVGRGSVQIDIGHYSSDPTANPHFTTTCTAGVDCNAARATVTVTDVRYLLASILNGQSGTSVQKNAIAAAQCQGSAMPFPMAVCQQALQTIPQDNVCGSVSTAFTMNPDSAQSACWTSLGSGAASSSFARSLFPPQCGGTPVETSLKQPVNLQNGVSNSVWTALQCCIACQDIHDYTVPVVDCSAMGNCNTSPPVLGFATIHIASPTDVSPPGGGTTNCNSAFSPWGSCGRQIRNSGANTITASQICKSGLSGRPGGTTCVNFANTVAPTLGQLP